MLVSTDIAEIVMVVVVKAPAGAKHQFNMTMSYRRPHCLLACCAAASTSANGASKLTPASEQHLQHQIADKQSA
jgi:hypothetical protein